MARLIAVGDIVMVEYSGQCYSTYQAWADKYNLGKFCWGQSIITEPGRNLYKVICKGKHISNNNKTILGLENIKTKQQYIFGADTEVDPMITIISRTSKQFEFDF